MLFTCCEDIVKSTLHKDDVLWLTFGYYNFYLEKSAVQNVKKHINIYEIWICLIEKYVCFTLLLPPLRMHADSWNI